MSIDVLCSSTLKGCILCPIYWFKIINILEPCLYPNFAVISVHPSLIFAVQNKSSNLILKYLLIYLKNTIFSFFWYFAIFCLFKWINLFEKLKNRQILKNKVIFLQNNLLINIYKLNIYHVLSLFGIIILEIIKIIFYCCLSVKNIITNI